MNILLNRTDFSDDSFLNNLSWFGLHHFVDISDIIPNLVVSVIFGLSDDLIATINVIINNSLGFFDYNSLSNLIINESSSVIHNLVTLKLA